MKKSGYWDGPGEGVGTFHDTTAAARTYLRDHGDQVAFVDLYEFTLKTLGAVNTETGITAGLVMRHAAADFDAVWEGKLYAGGGAADGWKLARKGMRTEIGTAVSELVAEVMVDGTEFLPPADGDAGTPRFGLGEAVHGGILEGCWVTMRRVLLERLPTYPMGPLPTTYGATTLFAGQVSGDSDIARSKVTLKIRSPFERFSAPIPRNIAQAPCMNTLYDPMCAVARSGSFGGEDFQLLTEIASWDDATNTATLADIPTQPADFFTLGYLQMTSGVLCGLKMPIVAHALGVIQVLLQPPREPAPGDTCVVQAGCDRIGILVDTATGERSRGTCHTKFNNLPNFRGAPYVPPPETAY